MEAIRVEVAELKEELRSTASELQTEASQLSAAALQQTTDTGSHIEQRAQQIRYTISRSVSNVSGLQTARLCIVSWRCLS